jgi:glycosyltransferase
MFTKLISDMKISIITATFNSEKIISTCLQSVASQTHYNTEHIVIDGGSTDGTLQTIQSLLNRVALVISEPEHEIYDALNKGIRQATGDIIGFVHSA